MCLHSRFGENRQMSIGKTTMKDSNLVYVDDQLRRLMRALGDIIFDAADQQMLNSNTRDYTVMNTKHRANISHAHSSGHQQLPNA